MTTRIFTKLLHGRCTAEDAVTLKSNIGKKVHIKGRCIIIESVEPAPDATDGTHNVTARLFWE